MKIITFLTVFFLTVASPLLVFGCGNILQKSDLPAEMPGDAEMNYSENGGMSPAYKHIKISGSLLVVEERTMQDRTLKSWYAEISFEDKEALYKAFVDNKFDTIRNDERKSVVYDAPSRGIYIKAGKVSKNISSDANSPISGANAKRWQNVRDVFTKLEAEYKDKAKQPNQNYAVIKYDAKTHDSIFKNVRNADLSDAEFSRIQVLTEKAANEHNKVIRSQNRIKDLSEYKFQYIAVFNDKNEKEVWVNAFCDSFEIDWKKQIVVVKDGGSCFFNLKINLKTSTAYDLQVNGEA